MAALTSTNVILNVVIIKFSHEVLIVFLRLVFIVTWGIRLALIILVVDIVSFEHFVLVLENLHLACV